MIIDVLVCSGGGNHTLEVREVPDDYFAGGGAEPAPDYDALLAGVMEGYANG
jgi:hypothetical protein